MLKIKPRFVQSHLNQRFLRNGISLRKFSTKEEQIVEEILSGNKDMVKVAAVDVDGVLRGKYISKEKFKSASKNGLAFCSVVFGWDCADVLYDNTKTVGWHMGYKDFPTKIDLGTYSIVPWEDNQPFFLMDFYDDDGKALEYCPRSLLKRVVERANKQGFGALVGSEYEFFNYKETPQSLKSKNYVGGLIEPLTPGMFGYSVNRIGKNREYFRALFEQITKSGIPVEGIHTETGPGVFEAAIQYSGAVEAADRATLFKSHVKDIARDFGIMPTFMAKPSSSLPGCGGHLHVNLTDKNGKNVFWDEKDPDRMSETFKHFLAGQIYCAPHILPMYAPTINSYKRFVEGYWAPTTVTWGIENRTVSLRVIPGNSKSMRVEVRLPGADMNPYFSIAASIASGLYGIQNKLPLKPGVTGTAYGDPKATASNVKEDDKLPRNLYEAADKMSKSKIAREMFGDVFVDHFTATRLWEWRQYQASVSNWEIERYFEII